MQRIDILKRRRDRLREDIVAQLDVLPYRDGRQVSFHVRPWSYHEGEGENGIFVCEKRNREASTGDDQAVQETVASSAEALQGQLGDS